DSVEVGLLRWRRRSFEAARHVLAIALRLWAGRRSGGKRGGPVVGVVADGADDLLARHDGERSAEIVCEPVLTGDGTGLRAGLVLVVVHEDDAVGVVSNEAECVFGGADGNVDVRAEIARMEVGVDSGDELVVV